MRLFICSLKSCVPGGHAGHRPVGVRQRCRRSAGSRRSRSVCERVVRRLVVALAGDRELDARDRLVGVDEDVERREQLARRDRARCGTRRTPAGTAASSRRRRARRARRRLRARERALDSLVRLHDRQVLRQVGEARQLRVQRQRGQRERDEQRRPRARRRAPAGAARRRTTAVQNAILAAAPVEDTGRLPLSTRSPSLCSSAGQHAQRADQRAEDDDHRPDADRREDRVAGEQHPGHRDQHRRAGDRAPPGPTSRRSAAAPRAATCPRAAPRARAGGRRASSRRRPPCRSSGSRTSSRRPRGRRGSTSAFRPDRGEHGREREQHRQAGRDERAERDEQDRRASAAATCTRRASCPR